MTTAPSASSGPKLYQVGTLTYTRAALAQVMFWMLLGVVFFQLMQMLPANAIPLQMRWAGASDTLIGLKSSLSSLVTFFWSPVVGSVSDRHRGPLGRRRPFILWTIPPLVLGLLGLGAAEPAGELLYQALTAVGLGAAVTVAGCVLVWLMVVMVVFLLFNTFLIQAYGCLIADVIPAEVMGKFSGLYRALGALASLAFNRWSLPWLEGHAFEVYAVTAGLYAVVFAVLVWRVQEGTYPAPPPKAPGGWRGAIKTYLRECFTHPFYLTFYVATFFNWASLAPMGYLVFFATTAGQPGYAETLGLSLEEFGRVKGWTFVVQIPVYLVVGHFVDRYHPVRVAVVGMLLETVTYVACHFFITGANSMLLWLCVNQVAIAIFLGAYMALGPRLFPRSRYGQFIAANGVFGITSLIGAPLLVGLVLDAIRDYRYIYLMCAICTGLATIANVALYRQWRRLGGDAGFTPPEPPGAQPQLSSP